MLTFITAKRPGDDYTWPVVIYNAGKGWEWAGRAATGINHIRLNAAFWCKSLWQAKTKRDDSRLLKPVWQQEALLTEVTAVFFILFMFCRYLTQGYYLIYYQMDCYETLRSHSWSPEHEAYQLWGPPDFFCSATMRFSECLHNGAVNCIPLRPIVDPLTFLWGQNLNFFSLCLNTSKTNGILMSLVSLVNNISMLSHTTFTKQFGDMLSVPEIPRISLWKKFRGWCKQFSHSAVCNQDFNGMMWMQQPAWLSTFV